MGTHARTDHPRHPWALGPVHLPSRHELGALAKRGMLWAKDLYTCMDRTRTFGLAAETAFWLFLSLIPLAAVAGLFAARISVEHWSEVAPLLSSLPRATQALVASQMVEVAAWNKGTVGVSAALVFLWLASSGIHSIFDSLELETDSVRPWWKKRAIALGTCFALSVAVPILAVLGPGLDGALGWLGEWIPLLQVSGEPTTLGRALRFAVGAGIVFGYVYALYWVGVPAPTRRTMPIAPGAAFAVVLEILFGLGYGLYVSRIGDGGAYSAGLAVVGVTLTGLYLFTVALLAGAVVNRKIARGRESCASAP